MILRIGLLRERLIRRYFYLTSRGISEEQAEAMVVNGLLNLLSRAAKYAVEIIV